MSQNPLAPAWLLEPDDVDALAASVWSRGSQRGDDGVVAVAGVPATELVARHGSPLYVVDEDDFRGRARGAKEAFDRELGRIGTSAIVYYAAKAFLSVEVARWVAEAGLRVDICTGGEFAVAAAAGVEPSRMAFHGNNKSLAEIDRTVAAGIGNIVVDNADEVVRVAEAASRHGVVQSVRVRVNSGVHASTHDYLATAREDQKFGITLADAPAVVAEIRRRPSLRFLGLHSHIGSQIFGSDGFGEAARRLLSLHADLLAGGPVPELNLGGGFGIAYTSVDDARPLDELAAALADIVAAECARLGISLPVVAVEPGRVIAGPAGTTLYTVGTVKDVAVTLDERTGETAVRRYVSVDGGMSDNARPALYEADYSARVVSRASSAGPALVRVAGKHCESGDLVVLAEYLPADVAPGDLLGVPATGAYCWSLASNYNHVGRPPVVAVRDGSSRVVVRGETEADLLARDAGLD
ncbi:diaminopimelate decarboxylase [Frigoribacterium sp. ACAM 257]|uniref:diaminopimelate decarboxylase n=1 Tax=Frigoribacterium sp. ACAM 257 TaxID=2508998 RepID=UPI0011B9868F|nr:diaminopimelate decarboxylase [Frigoribacterium sp. ACAM 257]TWX40466.1 diaminopimelate decarboxylase [Frigoribacterium sp. ACAM 257]